MLFFSVFTAVNSSVEYSLITELLKDYDINARPVSRHCDTVNVSIGLALRQVIDMVGWSQINMTRFLDETEPNWPSKFQVLCS